jgi:hypothetical protein
VCGIVVRTDNVSVGGGTDSLSCGRTSSCGSLDYAIYGILESGSSNPTITLVGPSVLNQNVDISG